MNGIWERVLANSFSGIHKSKIICSGEKKILASTSFKAIKRYRLLRRSTFMTNENIHKKRSTQKICTFLKELSREMDFAFDDRYG
jgi:hypothetical protein